MSDKAPQVVTKQARVQSVGATADATENVAESPVDGKITAVTYTPDAAITGANTNSRTLTVVNKGQDGTGTTNVATLALTSGVNIAASDEGALTLNGTAANLVVAEGDEIAFVSTHVGSSGLADPGGLVEVEFSRA